jgi:hypothetical protein
MIVKGPSRKTAILISAFGIQQEYPGGADADGKLIKFSRCAIKRGGGF